MVCRGEVDELVGVVHVRELIQWLRGTGDLAAFARSPLVVQESTTVLRLLELFRESGIHFATIVDEHGSVEGLVTPSDILQAIAGELPDVGGSDAPEAVQRGDNSWLVDGRLPIDAAERLFARNDMGAGDDYTTLAGFALAQLGHLPSTAEAFVWKDLRFEVVDMDGRRIDKLLVSRIDAVPP
jgi:putative hemolysin